MLGGSAGEPSRPRGMQPSREALKRLSGEPLNLKRYNLIIPPPDSL